MEYWRLFVAITLDEAVRERVRAAQTAARQAGFVARWVEPQAAHLTLKFLGDTERILIEPLSGILGQIATRHTPFALHTGALGAFPNARRPRVLWLGLDGALDHLTALQRAIDTALAPLGIPAERRPFRPHLTIGRVRETVPLPTAALATSQTHLGTATAMLPVAAIHLIRSELGRTGARYTTLATAMLGKSFSP